MSDIYILCTGILIGILLAIVFVTWYADRIRRGE